MKFRIGPINAATPTPLKSDGSFDRKAAVRLCRRWSDIELDGVLVLGSIGEGILLSEEVRTAFVECVLKEVGDQLTVFVSAADRTLQAMRERALLYASMGAPCIVLSAPVGVTSREAVDQVRSVAELCPAPCAYYEVPPVTSVTLNFHQIEEVLSHANICAFKDSSGNPLLAQELTSLQFKRDGVKLLDGVEYRAAYSALLGYDGVLHGGGVMTGRAVRDIWSAAKNGQIERALELDRQNSHFLAEIYNRLSGPVQNISGQKFALKLLGLLSSEYTIVDQPLNADARNRVEHVVERNRWWLT